MDFEQIEKNFDVGGLKFQGNCVWPILKSYLIGIEKETPIIKKASGSVIKLLAKNLFSDVLSLRNLGKSKVWVFTNSERRYYVENESFDRIATGLLNYLDNYVLFENPVPKGKTKKEKLQKGEFYVGMSWVYLIQFVLQKLSKKGTIENFDAFASYLKKDLSEIKKVFNRILAGEKLYDFLMKKYGPKAIFVVCYYSNFEMIRAAKKNKIPVIELQHGLVSTGHRAYYFSKPYGDEHLPDYFLSYGAYSSDVVTSGHVVRPGQTLDYGNSFLELVAGKLSMSKELESIKSSFKKVICITGQLPATDGPLLKMIDEVHHLFPEICFIFKPRHKNSVQTFEQRANFLQRFDINTYELLKYCDYHITVYSTCAMECLALGKPNISIDIKGYYTKFLRPMLDDNPYNHVVSDALELKKTLKILEKAEFKQADVKNSINHIFSKMVSSEDFLDFFDEVVK
ncbi:hypothetical protein [Allomuricauda sp. SCSIO 65647]|uniref:hypothetical protein n=1 Tax=Allomuricauda sp. SCSIO 65647 TaxID=2908843 RepID=UPI001F1DF823|nr:hypothetical protein [Muricauda sp. SCSIO 65647]UJH69043.1 hypothetical protein L0P89_07455 [Muricauda sp. SCSIO 65647]